jgi:hypothetical protein
MEKSMLIYFKIIITEEIISLIVEYTNLRISKINTNEIINSVYRKQFERLIRKEITIYEMYAFVGFLVIFGLTGKTDISVEEIWSERSLHYSHFPSDTMARERFQLITKNISLDNINSQLTAK